MEHTITKSDHDWKEQLSSEQYRILRKNGTERAFSGQYDKHYEDGTYICAGCGNPLFSSENKFDSGSGWPSYYQAIDQEAVAENSDHTLGMKRTEVLCRKCDGHLGHVFEDGPRPTGMRYCINSEALVFTPEEADITDDEQE